ncbi:hypothetical protein COCON_G00204820 [Conger conger]|uniref:Uncharacterized protein n=1 Tax=Conger conger TaxID=82655 RepID=A0A9Q1CYV4_CONCO|nr:hypothetical protein COCON_G00204820 [Conger conger]
MCQKRNRATCLWADGSTSIMFCNVSEVGGLFTAKASVCVCVYVCVSSIMFKAKGKDIIFFIWLHFRFGVLQLGAPF